MQQVFSCLALGVIFFMGLPGFGQGTPSQAPLNPAFEAYLESLRAGEARPLAVEDGQTLGYVPPPVDLSAVEATAAYEPKAVVSLPATYDLRTLGRLTSVRDQGGCGSCWSFASYASLESWLRGQGATWDLSENHLKECHGFSPAPCDGGNLFMSTAYMARLSGPVRESDDPYLASACGCSPGLSPRLWVRDVLVPPDISDSAPLNNAYLKQLVMDYGAVYTSMYYSGAYYLSAQYAYYYSGSAWGNHAVAIVGWDDAFDRARFLSAPPGNGAWIVRNSWGSSWGQSGYFYVSYYDRRFGEENGVFVNAEPPGDVVAYGYDPLGWTGNLGYGTSTAWGAAVFRAGVAGALVAVGTYAAASNTNYEVRIKDSLSGAVRATKTGTFAYPGYHTVALDTPVPLAAGSNFAVVVKYTTPSSTYPVPTEDRILGYTNAASALSGETYTSANGSTWSDLATSSFGSSVCIKAFLDLTPPPAPTPPALIGDFAASDGEDGQSTLSWTNPADVDLAQVIVQRKTGSYPTSHADGTTAYDNNSPAPGATASALDSGLANGTTYSYAVFSRDTAGAWNDAVQTGKNADTATPSAASPSGPVASWAMNEGSGKTIADATGRGHAGTITGATWTTSADGSGALSFDGRSDYVRVSTAADLSFGGPFTIEAWIRPSSLSGTKALLTKCGTSRQAIYGLWLNGTKLYAEVRNTSRSSGTTLTGTTALAVDTWYHVALRRDATGTVSLWLNGTREPATATVTGAVNPSQDLYIGRRNGSSSQDFKGRIDEVRIHARALDPGEFNLLPSLPTPPALVADFAASDGEAGQSTLSWTNPADADLAQVVVQRKTGSYPTSHTDGTTVHDSAMPTPGAAVSTIDSGLTNGTTYSYAAFSRNADGVWNDAVQSGKNADNGAPAAPASSGPIAYWHMDEGAGRATSDASGNGHTGTIVGATWTTSVDGSGALALDGRGDYVQVPTAPDLSFDGPFTIEAWIRPVALSGTKAILTKRGTSRQAIYGLWLSGDKLHAEVRNHDRSSGASLTGTTSLSAGTWYHVALRRDPSGTVTLWVSGVQEATAAVVTGTLNPSQALHIGRRNGSSSQDFRGSIDEVRIHNRALAPAEFNLLSGAVWSALEGNSFSLERIVSFPNPVREGEVTFRAEGEGIQRISVEVYTLSGDRLYASPWEAGTEQVWDPIGPAGEALARGIYILVLWARGPDGQEAVARATFVLFE